MGVRWLGVGFHPFARREDFEWVPKQRYGVMREYLPTRGGHALDMMLRTCTVQVNLDYASEADAMRKMRVALALSPATTAMFANSPWKEGRPHGGVTYRGRVWLDVDPDRTGLCPALWKRSSRFDDYVEWALDVPMFLFKRGGHAIANTGQTFRTFLKNGFEGHAANDGGLEDAPQHALPRGAPQEDHRSARGRRAVDRHGVRASRALDGHPLRRPGARRGRGARRRAGRTTRSPSCARASGATGCAPRSAAGSLIEIGQRMVAIAEGGLERRAVMDAECGKDERVHLARLRKLVGEGRCPADVLLARPRSRARSRRRTSSSAPR